MISLSDALEQLLAHRPTIRTIRTAPEAALGRVLAAAVTAGCSSPGAPITLLDGWAVAAAETVGASAYSPCFPARPPKPVTLGEALPLGCDAVLPPQAVAIAPGLVEILAPAAPGEGVRATGRDFTAGEILVGRGDMLHATGPELLRLAGVESVETFIPQLQVLAREGSADWLVELARREGVDCDLQSCVAPGEAAPPVRLSGSDTDIAIVVGDVAALENVDESRVLFRELAVRPGRFTVAALLPRRADPQVERIDPLITLFVADRVENLLAAWLLLVRPLLREAVDARARKAQTVLPLARKVVSDPGWSEMVLLRQAAEPGVGSPHWDVLATGDLPFHAIARADAWTLVEAASEGWAAGEPVAAEAL